MLLSDAAVILHKAVQDRHLKFTLSAGAYAIDDFNVKVKVAVLQQRQNWEAPQIIDLKLVTLEN